MINNIHYDILPQVWNDNKLEWQFQICTDILLWQLGFLPKHYIIVSMSVSSSFFRGKPLKQNHQLSVSLQQIYNSIGFKSSAKCHTGIMGSRGQLADFDHFWLYYILYIIYYIIMIFHHQNCLPCLLWCYAADFTCVILQSCSHFDLMYELTLDLQQQKSQNSSKKQVDLFPCQNREHVMNHFYNWECKY